MLDKYRSNNDIKGMITPRDNQPTGCVRIQVFGDEGSECMTVYGPTSAALVAEEIFNDQNAERRRAVRRRKQLFLPSVDSAARDERPLLQGQAANANSTAPNAESQEK